MKQPRVKAVQILQFIEHQASDAARACTTSSNERTRNYARLYARVSWETFELASVVAHQPSEVQKLILRVLRVAGMFARPLRRRRLSNKILKTKRNAAPRPRLFSDDQLLDAAKKARHMKDLTVMLRASRRTVTAHGKRMCDARDCRMLELVEIKPWLVSSPRASSDSAR